MQSLLTWSNLADLVQTHSSPTFGDEIFDIVSLKVFVGANVAISIKKTLCQSAFFGQTIAACDIFRSAFL